VALANLGVFHNIYQPSIYSEIFSASKGKKKRKEEHLRRLL
jgi:hypothetical protein